MAGASAQPPGTTGAGGARSAPRGATSAPPMIRELGLPFATWPASLSPPRSTRPLRRWRPGPKLPSAVGVIPAMVGMRGATR